MGSTRVRIESFGLLACLMAANAVFAQAPADVIVSPASPVVPTTVVQSSVQSAPVEAPLWQQLREGMTYEEAAAALRATDGVRSVRVKLKKQKPVALSISYVGSGVSVGPMVATITPVFEDDKLASVSLISDDCLSTGLAKNNTISDGLREKYGHYVSVKVVDDNGVHTDDQKAY